MEAAYDCVYAAPCSLDICTQLLSTPPPPSMSVLSPRLLLASFRCLLSRCHKLSMCDDYTIHDYAYAYCCATPPVALFFVYGKKTKTDKTDFVTTQLRLLTKGRTRIAPSHKFRNELFITTTVVVVVVINDGSSRKDCVCLWISWLWSVAIVWD
jgi:hypothetical protein